MKDLRIHATPNGIWVDIFDGIDKNASLTSTTFIVGSVLSAAYADYKAMAVGGAGRVVGEGYRNERGFEAHSFEEAEEIMLKMGEAARRFSDAAFTEAPSDAKAVQP